MKKKKKAFNQMQGKSTLCLAEDELICDIFLWTPSHGRAKAGRPTRTYIQQLCADTGYSLEDLPGTTDDRDGWWEGQGDPCWEHDMMMMK